MYIYTNTHTYVYICGGYFGHTFPLLTEDFFKKEKTLEIVSILNTPISPSEYTFINILNIFFKMTIVLSLKQDLRQSLTAFNCYFAQNI